MFSVVKNINNNNVILHNSFLQVPPKVQLAIKPVWQYF